MSHMVRLELWRIHILLRIPLQVNDDRTCQKTGGCLFSAAYSAEHTQSVPEPRKGGSGDRALWRPQNRV
jgi:hypothetical protein